MKKLAVLFVVAMLAGPLLAGQTGWESYVIRNSTVGNIAPVISDISGGRLFEINLGGQKAGWGTNNINGQKLGDIQSICINRDSNVTGYGPYLNFWVIDGNGNYAVIANEPSNLGEWSPGTAYDTTWNILKNATAKVYETNGQPFILPAGTTFTFEDFADYIIATPTSHWGGAGAPDDLLAGSYTAYGVNWIFGDTQSNYLDGYLVSDPCVHGVSAPIPAPGALLLAGLGTGLVGWLRRRKA